MLKNVLFVAACFFVSMAPAFAQEANTQILVDEADLTPELLEKIRQHPETGIGVQVGDELNSAMSRLNEEGVRFSETPVGILTMFIVAYKVVGQDLLQAAIGIPLFLFGTLFFVWVYKRNCVTSRFLVCEKDDEKKYEVCVGQHINYGLVYFGAYLVFVIAMSALIFA